MIKNLAKYAIKLKFMRENNMPDPVKANFADVLGYKERCWPKMV